MAKNKKGKLIKLQPLPIKKYIVENARKLPIRGCYTFGTTQGLTQIYVVREKRNGNVIVGFYLVDAYCLGLKNTFFTEFDNFDEFYDALTSGKYGYEALQEMKTIYAQNLIYGAIEYAEDAGFEPHKDFALTEYLLDDVETIEFIDIEFGQNGKYTYWEGQYDNVKKVLATLDKNIGVGNYFYVGNFGSMNNFAEFNPFEEKEEYPEKYLDKIEELDQLSIDQREKIFSRNLEDISSDAMLMYSASQVCVLGLFQLWENEKDLEKLYKNEPQNIIAIAQKYFDDKNLNSKPIHIPKGVIIFCIENLIHFHSPNFVLLDDFVLAVKSQSEKGVLNGFTQEIFDFLLSFHFKRTNTLVILMNKISKISFGVENFKDLSNAKLSIAIEKLIELICSNEVENMWQDLVYDLDFLEYLENFLPNESNDEIRKRVRNILAEICE